MGQPSDFKSLQESIQTALVSTTRTVGQISAEDLGFQRSLSRDVGEAIDEQNARLLGISSSILQSAAALTDSEAPSLREVDDVDTNWRGVVDVVDSLLERADTCLDEYTGVIKRKAPPVEQPSAPKSKKLGNAYRTQNIMKPQLGFREKPLNHRTEPWKPLLQSKPHAIVPLEDSLVTAPNEYGQPQFKHPYETEIQHMQYPASVFEKADPISYGPMESTSATFVTTYEGVLEMLEDLKGAKEIAVDLEHHDVRSYVGLVSLMQISTREKDWIVDTLRPWRQDLQVLNEVFANPSIVKVFHGAFMDIVWLQRDLGLYINGLFDTHHACRALEYPGGSLAYLLKRFIDFDADKQFQMADWRIRPIPKEMFFYARADTHFLLYIYDHMRNELIDRSKPNPPEADRLRRVLTRSRETSLLRYEAQAYDAETGRGPGGWFAALAKAPMLLSKEQFAVFRAVHGWRDRVARQDDESTNFVMPNHMVLSVAKIMPADLAAIHSTVRPMSHSVKARADELLQTITAAKESGKDGPSMMDALRSDAGGAVTLSNGRTAAIAEPEEQAVAVTALSAALDGDLRTERSAFWGGAFGSSTWDERSSTLTQAGSDLKLAIPLPQLAEEAFSEGVVVAEPAQEEALPVVEEPAPPAVEEQPFTIRGGKKRKSEAVEAEESGAAPAGEYDISLHDDEDEAAREKAEQKTRRKAEKKAAKRGKVAEDAAPAPEEEEEEEPFDYSKAESVLHQKRTREPARGNKREKKQPFDPYSKSANAPKGMRRVQTERPGKSFTFKG